MSHELHYNTIRNVYLSVLRSHELCNIRPLATVVVDRHLLRCHAFTSSEFSLNVSGWNALSIDDVLACTDRLPACCALSAWGKGRRLSSDRLPCTILSKELCATNGQELFETVVSSVYGVSLQMSIARVGFPNSQCDISYEGYKARRKVLNTGSTYPTPADTALLNCILVTSQSGMSKRLLGLTTKL